MTTVSSASAAVTECAKAVTPRCTNSGKLRVMCRYGGSIVSLPQTKSPRYVGGDTRIVAVPPSAETSVASLVSHLAVTLGISYDFKVKYQLPDQELDSLISVETDEDVQIMMEEHGYLTCESSIPKTRVRLFLFPSKTQGGASQGDPAQCKAGEEAAGDVDWLGIGESNPTQPVLQHPKTDTWFVDALKGVEMMQTGGNNSGSSAGSGGGICGQESMMLETNSSFGSTSSSVSSSKLPPMKSTGEDNTSNSQVKFAPIESLTSGNTAATPISSHELPTSPHVLETKLSPNMYEPDLNKPVAVSGYPQFLNQAQQQQQQPIYVVYTGQPPYMTGNSPMPLPAYQHMNPIHYQLQPQPYPVYYPVEQYNSRYVQAPPVRHNTALNTHHVESPVARTSSPLAPEFSSQVYLPPKPVDSSSVQTSSEAGVSTTCKDDFIYNTDLDDDTARAQLYKSQPPAPIVSSELQTMMLTEALGQLNTHKG
ncbi:hypothetical protein IGI04_041345 [Brassica rapa subsp. trilocularis]|uniref:PB1 domain-containing protein n=2 Tax=Brassica TaxID=3705 RepID=A0ABQ8BR18_BRANA|nr:uncharacterized protein LOC106372018 [Brassica napus]KAG5376749.1 hypothetical protein IGI04_041345 [Brassica rapa subsp. trilocularis]KAH0907257.1 hypothetical protein HID58_039084 [Brassica napus]